MTPVIEKRKFDQGINADDSLTKLEPGEYFNGFNFRGFTSEDGHISGLQPIHSTKSIFSALPVGTNYCIGGSYDESAQRIVWANWNSSGDHGIYCYDTVNLAAMPVLLNSQVKGGLNFDRFHLIHSSFVLNGCWYFTENFNEPRRINIDAGIEMNIDPSATGLLANTNYAPVSIFDPSNGVFKDSSFIPFTFELPLSPTPSYQSGQISYKLIVHGSGSAAPIELDIFLNWAVYPAESPASVFGDGLVADFSSRGTSGVDWSILAGYNTLTIYIHKGWDFGTGDVNFGAIAAVNMLINYQVPVGFPPHYEYNPDFLPVSSVDPLNGTFKDSSFVPFTFQLPATPIPSYSSGKIFYYLFATGADGKGIVPIKVNLNWASYPGEGPGAIFGDGAVGALSARGTAGTDWDIASGYNSVTIYIKKTWDFGTGDPGFHTVASLNMLASTIVRDDGGNVNPYISQLSQSVLSLIRRQPALPPIVAKGYDVLRTLNNVAKEGFLFSYRYTYREFEQSTLSGLSNLINYNADGDLSNYIAIALPLQEQIDQDIIRIDLVAEFITSGVSFIIKTWDRSITDDANAIAQHNLGTALSFNFYNDMIGDTLDTAYSVKEFDNVPILSQTFERAKNKAFLGGNVLGYDTPQVSSLKIAAQTGSTTTPPVPAGEWFMIKFLSGIPPSSSTYFMIYISNFTGYLGGNGYYKMIVPPGGPALPTSVAYTNLQFLGPDPYTAALALGGVTSVLILDFVDQNVAVAITGLPAPSVSSGQLIFKSADTRQAAIFFADRAGRRCGVYTKDPLKVITPERNYSTIPYTSSLKWTLANTNVLNEIPVWAYTYSILLTKSLRTRFFLQGKGKNAVYATKDASGNYVFTQNAYSPTAAGCAFDISNILAFQMGYTFNEGDVMKIYQSTGFPAKALAELNIIGVSGNWVITELQEINPILDNTTQFIFEIYTPYKKSTAEPFFETGQTYLVSNPGTDNRTYSVLTGTIIGDVYVRSRDVSPNNYFTEAMSPTDKFWKIWNTNTGRPNFVEAIGRVNKSQSISFSNAFIQGAQTNGLSTFDALDTLDLSAEFGSLQKLVLTSKIQKEGTVMLAICQAETVSLYLSETQVTAPQGNAFLSVSASVIGTVYPLKGSQGCGDPESVQQWNGEVFWFNRYKGTVVQYSDNGLEPISKFKARTFWRAFAAKYSSLTRAQIEALGSRPFVFGGIDPFNEEYLLSIPQVEAANPNGVLPGNIAGSPANLFPIYDGMGKTMVFKIEANRWMPACNFSPDYLIYASNLLFGFSKGTLYVHNDTGSGYNTFYGKTYPSVIMFPGNKLPNSPKQALAINVETDGVPDVCYAYTTYPNTQITDIQPGEWTDYEGIFYAPIKRDRLSPAFTDPDLALNFGDKIVAKAPMIQLNFIPTGPFNLKYVNIGYEVSAGHKTIETP